MPEHTYTDLLGALRVAHGRLGGTYRLWLEQRRQDFTEEEAKKHLGQIKALGELMKLLQPFVDRIAPPAEEDSEGQPEG